MIRVVIILLTLAQFCHAVERKGAEPDLKEDLAGIRRIYVEPLKGGAIAEQMRDMIIAAVQNSGICLITESPERADAVLRGSADERTYTERHITTDSIGFHTSQGSGSGTSSSMSGTASSRQNTGAGITDNESAHIEERRNDTSTSLRLVNPGGDVLWSTTQESGGGKFRGAMADVADKVSRQLVTDMRKARAARPVQ